MTSAGGKAADEVLAFLQSFNSFTTLSCFFTWYFPWSATACAPDARVVCGAVPGIVKRRRRAQARPPFPAMGCSCTLGHLHDNLERQQRKAEE